MDESILVSDDVITIPPSEVVVDPKANLIRLLKASRDGAISQLDGCDEYGAKQLRRHIDAMNLQIETVETGKFPERKKGKKT